MGFHHEFRPILWTEVLPTSTINQSFAECNASLYNSGCTVQCISVRWIPKPGSSYSCTPANLFIYQARQSLDSLYPLSFPILGGRDSIRALQSSPFQNPGGVVQAWRRTNKRTNERRRKSSCLILDVCSQCHQSSSAAFSEWLPKQWWVMTKYKKKTFSHTKVFSPNKIRDKFSKLICPYVCMFTLEIPFKRLCAPTSWSPMFYYKRV